MTVLRIAIVLGIVIFLVSPSCSAYLKAALGFRIGLSPEEKGYGQKGNYGAVGTGAKAQFLTGVHGQPPGGHGGKSLGGSFMRHLKILGVNLYLGGQRKPQQSAWKPNSDFGKAQQQFQLYKGPGGFGSQGGGFGHGTHYSGGHNEQNHHQAEEEPKSPEGPPTQEGEQHSKGFGGIDFAQNEVGFEGHQNGHDNSQDGKSSSFIASGSSNNAIGSMFSPKLFPNSNIMQIPAASQMQTYSNEINNELKFHNGKAQGQNPQSQIPQMVQLQLAGPPQFQQTRPLLKFVGGPPPKQGFSLASLMKGPQWSPKPNRPKFRWSLFNPRGPPPRPMHFHGPPPPGHPSRGPPPPHPSHGPPPPHPSHGPPRPHPSHGPPPPHHNHGPPPPHPSHGPPHHNHGPPQNHPHGPPHPNHPHGPPPPNHPHGPPPPNHPHGPPQNHPNGPPPPNFHGPHQLHPSQGPPQHSPQGQSSMFLPQKMTPMSSVPTNQIQKNPPPMYSTLFPANGAKNALAQSSTIPSMNQHQYQHQIYNVKNNNPSSNEVRTYQQNQQRPNFQSQQPSHMNKPHPQQNRPQFQAQNQFRPQQGSQQGQFQSPFKSLGSLSAFQNFPNFQAPTFNPIPGFNTAQGSNPFGQSERPVSFDKSRGSFGPNEGSNFGQPAASNAVGSNPSSLNPAGQNPFISQPQGQNGQFSSPGQVEFSQGQPDFGSSQGKAGFSTLPQEFPSGQPGQNGQQTFPSNEPGQHDHVVFGQSQQDSPAFGLGQQGNSGFGQGQQNNPGFGQGQQSNSGFGQGPQGNLGFGQISSAFNQGQPEFSPQGGGQSEGQVEFSPQNNGGQVEFGPGSNDQFNQNSMPFQLPDGYAYSHSVSSPVMSMNKYTKDDPPVEMNPESMQADFSHQKEQIAKLPTTKDSNAKVSIITKDTYSSTANSDDIKTQIQSPIRKKAFRVKGKALSMSMMTAASSNQHQQLKEQLKQWMPVLIKKSRSAKAKSSSETVETDVITPTKELSVQSPNSSLERSMVIRKRSTTPSTVTTTAQTKSKTKKA